MKLIRGHRISKKKIRGHKLFALPDKNFNKLILSQYQLPLYKNTVQATAFSHNKSSLEIYLHTIFF